MTPIGRRVLNRGDVCNAPREGTITAVRSDQWGTFATVTYDTCETVGWYDDGSPIVFLQATGDVALRDIAEPDAPGYSRFVYRPGRPADMPYTVRFLLDGSSAWRSWTEPYPTLERARRGIACWDDKPDFCSAEVWHAGRRIYATGRST
jgi:hypothetical protein